MKRKKTNDHYTVLFFLIIVLVTISSCDSMLADDQSEMNLERAKPNISIDNLNLESDILYMVSYEEVTSSYSSRIPERISKSADRYVLRGFERVQKTYMIDRNGYIHSTTVWLDSNTDETIPKDLRVNYENSPQHGQGHKPVVRSEMTHGSIRYLSEKGEVLYEYEVDLEALRLNQRDLNKLMSENRSRNSREENVKKNLDMLNQMGIGFERVGENHARFSNKVNDDNDISMQKVQIDLRNGKVIASIDLGNKGNVKNRMTMKYEEVNNIPVEKYKVSENFGERNGEWTLTDRTVVNRSNIQTFIKN